MEELKGMLARGAIATVKALFTGSLTTKLMVLVALAIGLSLLRPYAGPATRELITAIIVLAAFVGIFGLLFGRRRR